MKFVLHKSSIHRKNFYFPFFFKAPHGTKLGNRLQIPDAFIPYFSDASRDENYNLYIHHQKQSIFWDIDFKYTNQERYNTAITPLELQTAIKNINQAARSSDNFHIHLLRHTPNTVISTIIGEWQHAFFSAISVQFNMKQITSSHTSTDWSSPNATAVARISRTVSTDSALHIMRRSDFPSGAFPTSPTIGVLCKSKEWPLQPNLVRKLR